MKGRKTGGRRPGTRNKITRDIRALAQAFTVKAIEELARLATGAESESARVAAIKELLDRAHGKAMQRMEGSLDVNMHDGARDKLRDKLDRFSGRGSAG